MPFKKCRKKTSGCADWRFSYLALLAVIGLAASGVINTWFMLNRVQELVTTEYGRLLLVKVALFLTMLAFAAANRLWLRPRLLLTATTGAQKDALQRLCLFTTIEATLGLAVVCVVALLGQPPPAAHIHAG
jgi:putative copper resistance protein D